MSATWRQRAKEELREGLYETAMTLFRTKGYDEVTVQEITREAGVAKGTFFNHFPTKEHVVVEWYRRITSEAMDEVRGRSFDSAEAAVLAATDAIAVRGTAAPGLVAAKARLLSTFEPLADAEREQDHEARRFLIERIESGRASGELAEDVAAEFLSDAILAMLTGTARHWIAAGHEFDLRRTVAERTAFLFRAARAPRAES